MTDPISITIKNYRGCSSATVELNPIALVGGKNAAGKSSICQAAACVATGTVLPIPGLKKTDAAALVKDGADQGYALVKRGDDGQAEIVWPQADYGTRGSWPQATPIAAGLTSLLDMKVDERSKLIAALLKSDPVRPDVEAWFFEKGLTAEDVEAAWKSVGRHGWDEAAEVQRIATLKLKGSWEEVAGRKWGSKIAVSWQPEEWDVGFIDLTAEIAQERIDKARTNLERLQALMAVSGAEREKLEQAAAVKDYRQTAAEQAKTAFEAAQAKVKALQEKKAALPSAADAAGLPCPHCGEPVAMRQVKLGEWTIEKVPPKLDDAELKKRRTAHATVDGDLSKALGELSQAQRVRTQADNLLEESIAAETKLNLSEKQDGPSREEVEAARNSLTVAEGRANAFKRWRRASDIAASIQKGVIITEALQADGIRQKKLAGAIETFNRAALGPLCETAGWAPVELQPDMRFTFGGRDVRLCSVSEGFRTRLVLQIAQARLDGSSFVIIDGADVLIAAERNGLFQMLTGCDIPALVALSLGKREQLPDLAAAGLGASWWIEHGIATPIAAAAA